MKRKPSLVVWLTATLAATACAPPESDRRGADDPTEPVTSLASSLDSLLSLADTIHFAGDYAEARELRSEVLFRARERGDTRAEARALTGLGISAWRLGDYAEARDFGEEALALKIERDLTDRLSRSYNALGLLAWNENRFSDAQELFDEAITWGRHTDAEGAVATARGNLALVQMEWGDFRAAREGFLAMRDTMAAIGQSVRLGNSLLNLGELEMRMGNPAGAVAWFSQAREVYEPGSPGEAFFLGHVASAYAALGNQGAAFAVLDTALQMVRRQGNRQEEAIDLELLADQYREAGDFRRALDFYRAAQEINGELGLTMETATDLRYEAHIHMRLRAPDLALELALEALDIHREVGAPFEELSDHLLLAEIYHELGQVDEVASRLEAGRRLAADLAVRSARLAVALTEARVAESVGDYERILEVLTRSTDDLQRSGYAEEWQAHYLAARAHSGLGMSDSAVAAGWRALDTVERVRGSYASGSLRTAFSTEKRDVYAQLISDLRDMGRVAETHPSDVPYYVTDNRDVAARTGWRPKRSVEDTFGDIFRWLDAHRSELEPLLS